MKTIYHIEIQFGPIGKKKSARHSYYTSLVALVRDNEEDVLDVGIHTLQRVKDWPYTRKWENGGYACKYTIRKGIAYTTGDIEKYYDVPPAEDIRDQYTCPKCGQVNADPSGYCLACGTLINEKI